VDLLETPSAARLTVADRGYSPGAEAPERTRNMEEVTQKIVLILKANEENLSDGYGYYCGAGRVNEVLQGIAAEIEAAAELAALTADRDRLAAELAQARKLLFRIKELSTYSTVEMDFYKGKCAAFLASTEPKP
jgi:hypothetical protein